MMFLLFNRMSLLFTLTLILILTHEYSKKTFCNLIVQIYFGFRPRDIYRRAREEMLAYREFNNTPAGNYKQEIAKVKKEVFNTVFFEYPAYEELEEYIKTHWGKSCAFLNLAYRRCDLRNGDYNKSLILWSEITPIKRLDDNQRLELLKYNLLLPIYDWKAQSICDNVEVLFCNYKPSEIITLFNASYEASEYKRLLFQYAARSKFPNPFPVFKRMNSLLDYMQFFLEEEGDVYPRAMKSLEGSCELGRVERISSLGELVETAYDFSNCLRSYHKRCLRGEAFVYKISSKDPIVFHVDKEGVIGEAKHKANRILSEKEMRELKTYVFKKIY